jgi:hypothetical protein
VDRKGISTNPQCWAYMFAGFLLRFKMGDVLFAGPQPINRHDPKPVITSPRGKVLWSFFNALTVICVNLRKSANNFLKIRVLSVLIRG